MASYPTGVYSPSAKSAGQTITAAMFNDPEAEISAVENALLNGLPHALTISTGGLTVSTGSVNIGGPSSLATVQVNGNSTFVGTIAASSNVTIAGSLAVTGGSTFTGAVVFSTTVTFASALQPSRLDGCRLTHSAAQEIANGSYVGLSWDTETWQTGTGHSTSANSSRYTFPSTGIWDLGCNVEWYAHASGYRECRLMLNDTNVLANDLKPVASGETSHNLHTRWLVTSTADYVTVRLYQNSGSTSRITVRNYSSPAFWANKVSS